MSETSGPTEGSAENNGSKRGVRGWLADLFSEEPEGIPELVSILRAAASRNLIDEDVLNIILGAVQVSELRARDIMIQRSSLVVIKEEQSIEQLLPIVVESRHSRFPVVGEDMDDVKGILHAKDLLPLVLEKDLEQFVLKNCLRPATVIPESKRLNILLQEFRSTKNHMAVVVDEYGQVAGAITIEDVLEQIVGDIEDEHDIDEGPTINEVAPGIFHVRANTEVHEFNERLALKLDEDEFDTIGGLVMNRFGHVPDPGEQIQIETINFMVLSSDSRRIRLLKVEKPDAVTN